MAISAPIGRYGAGARSSVDPEEFRESLKQFQVAFQDGDDVFMTLHVRGRRQLTRRTLTRRPVGAESLLSRGEAGHLGLGEEPVGDTDARVARRQEPWLLQVYPIGGEHLVGYLAAAVRVGEVGQAVAA